MKAASEQTGVQQSTWGIRTRAFPLRTAERLFKGGESVLTFVSPETTQFLAAANVFEARRISFSLLDHSDENFFSMLIDVSYAHISGLLSNLFQSHTLAPLSNLLERVAITL
jgi:hypothetical protein